ncbi:HpcH/HpaI aldolase/citrate lyase family protein [Salipiger sp. HF18]|uniref:HpcH/HpaI aldolase/citrate lyase family protein n=1 Tax=Salipiger sp. HF18 TaxID=2721557 RepID=UPI00142E63EE|nr:HpcH/HpaI aldolase/citrate lyase family protein [Salipiger sp. HF18]NIY95302.1 HpcH/HpaI aldolase/citrate lyase family protein [Salipiger sp. HF18]
MAGRRLEEVREGEVLRRAITRTVTEADNVRISVQTMARNPTLFGAVAAEVQPVDAVWTDIRDLDGLAAESRAAVRDGFAGKLAIHPAQVPVSNRGFQPSDEEVNTARRTVAAFPADPAAGVAALDGAMIDMPHLKRSRLILQRAGIPA